jgi:hypothetical protein
MILQHELVTIVGGTLVGVFLQDVLNWNDAPTTELTTRFLYRVEGKAQTWSYSVMIDDYMPYPAMLELFRAEVARWKQLEEIPASRTTEKD